VRRAALLALLVLAGCGSDGGESATQLLDRGFATDVRSGVITVEAELRLDGLAGLAGPFLTSMEGSFEGGGPTELPDMDMDFRATGMGRDFAGRVVITGDNAWVEYEGTTYEAGEQLWGELQRAIEEPQPGMPRTFAEAGIDPLDWLEDLETDGGEEVAGVETTKVTGNVDVGALLRDLIRLSGEQLPESVVRQVEDAVEDISITGWIGEDDIWRRVSAEAAFEVPEGQRESAGGLSGGRVTLEMELAEPNEPVEIDPPAGGRSLDELLRRLGIPPEQLLGPGFAAPAPG
jgi:hypothetical protein